MKFFATLFLMMELATWATARATEPPGRLRLLLPRTPYTNPSNDQLRAFVAAYNREHPGSPVEILTRGDAHSSIRDIVAMNLAGSPPELAAIELSEGPALEPLRLTRPVKIRTLGGEARGLLPFRQTLPIVVSDPEKAPRPRDWASWIKTARGSRLPIALPLQGPLGLWIFEALNSPQPLWSRERGGIRVNRALGPAVQDLQSLIDAGLARAEESWETALTSFLDRQSPYLVTSSDMLPYIAARAPFRWEASPLPSRHGGAAALPTGSLLAVLANTPEVGRFLEALYEPARAVRWTTEAYYLPPSSQALRDPRYASELRALPAAKTLQGLSSGPLRARTTDPEVMRAHSEWIQGLRALFGEASKRLATERVFTQIEAKLAQREH